MAFTSSTSGSGANEGTKGFKKADRFINLYLTGLDGKPVKVSFIGLHADVPHEQAIIDYLDANPEGTKDVLSAMTADYRNGVSTKVFAGFKFGA
jgi:hypothetical protein